MGLTRPKLAQVTTTTAAFNDPVIVINNGAEGTNTKDIGIVFERGDDQNRVLLWDESADEFVLANSTEQGSTAGNVTLAAYSDLQVAGLKASSFVLNGTLTFPTSDGSAGYVLSTDGAGNLSWSAAGGSYTAGTGLSLSGNEFSIDSTVTTLTGTQTLTNKTLTSPVISTISNTGTLTLPTTTGTVALTSDITLSTLSVTATAAELNYTDGVTSNIQTQLNAKAPTASPTLTGTPLAPTAPAGTNTTQIATTAFVSTAVSNLVDSAPGTLDTLNELAAALGDDANFSTTVTTSIGEKLAKASNLSDLTNAATARTNLGLGSAATAASTDFVSATGSDTMSGTLTVQTLSVGTNTVTTTSDIALSANVAINGENSLSFGLTDSTSGYYRWMFGNTSKTSGVAGGTEKMKLDKDGNLTLSGTVDGRDVASDGSKLDGIESGATADQTASEILTLIKTVDGAGSGLDADTLDGYQSATSATANTIALRDGSGNLTAGIFSGTATSAQYADLAEKYMPDAEYTAGTVLQFGGEQEVTLADEYATRRVAGVVSTNPAFMMNEQLDGGVYIALSGRVPCRATGIVHPGDLMVASNTPGVAVAWDDPLRDPPAGSIIGKAIKGKALAGEELIEVVVGVR